MGNNFYGFVKYEGIFFSFLELWMQTKKDFYSNLKNLKQKCLIK